jgi:predicted homoserine dehydrogenase-like protein
LTIDIRILYDEFLVIKFKENKLNHSKYKVGVVGTGFIAQGFLSLVNASRDFEVSKILTRRPIETIDWVASKYLTQSLNELIDNCDIVFECSGDVYHATEAILAATKAGLKVITLDAEFHVTTGSYFTQQGHYVTDADGDQPGCLARLKTEIEGMGFKPKAYVNIKGFINLNPEKKEMQYWSEQQGIREEQVVSFTDGSKLQIEQAFVANGLGATIPPDGMFGARVETLNDLDYLIDASDDAGLPISDFVLCKGAPPGELIVAESEEADRLGKYIVGPMKTTKGKGYILLRPYHLCHLEVLNTMRKAIAGEPMLLNNSAKPRLTVASVAKRPIKQDEIITRGAGGYDVRGVAVQLNDNLDAVPICLLKDIKVVKNVEPGEILRFEHVDFPTSIALDIYQKIITN